MKLELLKRVCFLSVSLCTLLLWLSCGKADKSPAEKQIVLTLVHWYGSQRDNWQNEIIEPFEREHANIKVEMDVVPYSLYYAKTLASAASGVPMGDVVAIDDWFAPELFKRDYTVDLQHYFDRDFKAQDFITQVFEMCRFPLGENGDLLAIPFATGTTVLFYNRDLFDQAGVSYPDSNWTYADLLVAARKLTRDIDGDGITDQWGILADDGTYTGFDTMLYSLGGQILSPDLKQSWIDRPKSVAALQYIVDLVRKEKVSPLPSSLESMGEKFGSEKVAMVITGDFVKLALKDVRFRWDITLPPKGPAGLRLSRRFGNSFCIPRQSQHPNEAWELIKYILTSPSRGRLNELFESMMPVYKSLAFSKDWIEGVPLCNRRAIIETEEKYSFFHITPGWLEWREQALTPEVQNAMTGRKSVLEAAHDAATKISAILKQGEPGKAPL
jgi:multiple sugar transport system substrate-binding protein